MRPWIGACGAPGPSERWRGPSGRASDSFMHAVAACEAEPGAGLVRARGLVLPLHHPALSEDDGGG